MKYLILILLVSLFAGCTAKINPGTTKEETTIPVPTPEPETPDPLPNLKDPYKIRVIAHGGDYGNTPQYSTVQDTQLTGDQSIFVTDSRINIKIKALASPGQVNQDSQGVKCSQMAMTYSKLQVKIGIKKHNGTSYIDTYIFDNIFLNTLSQNKYFPVPVNSANEPFEIEVLDTRWDYSCLKGQTQYCPYERVWEHDCFEIEIHLATDHTNDLDATPGI